MSPLAEIIYLADMIEPLRNYPGVGRLRDLSGADLQAAVLTGLESSIEYCMVSGMLVHPISIEARNHLLVQNNSFGSE
jgi:HD superfamily phosphohydrolase YqeK